MVRRYGMIVLREKDGDLLVGEISERQLQSLKDALEEETDEDQDYWINRATLDLLRENGVDQRVVDMIAAAMGDREDIEVRWSEE
jgi:processive 1,2-diacylglycerol beta-glucosyltransferase